MRAHGLDVLRGITILMVLVTHTNIRSFLTANLEAGSQVAIWNIFRMGQFGVDIFFVISGFLVTSMIFNEIKKNNILDFRRFWLRRGLKVWPAYFLVYGSLGLLYSAYQFYKYGWGGFSGYWSEAWVNLVFLQNYVNMQSRWFASWSVCVEEHFYLVLPLIFIILLRARNGISVLPVVCLAGILVCNLLRFDVAHQGEYQEIWRQTHFRMDSLLIGVLFAYIYHQKPLFWQAIVKARWALLGLGLLIFIIQYRLLWNPEIAYSIGLLMVAIAGMCFVVFSMQARNDVVQKVGLLNVIRLIGVASYSIYVCQSFGMLAYRVDGWTHGTFFENFPVGALLFWTISITMGLVVHRVIEKPVLVIRDRLLPRKAASIATVAA